MTIRLNSAGLLDNTFNGNGIVITDVGLNSNDYVEAIITAENGSLYTA